ncbi:MULTISPECIES: hypothetical protein [unclassified Photobacterium]|uniref:hypothetical protein n=1 Tax=unclassified Photobacterium TaxID=2628852 RepID=UPI001EDCE439|nr:MULTISPECIES: hypothetical protein [unclassified Photobacterium]MCG3865815.1 hypothetical protein [Photobacterium sp. Ph6]MCG3877290.1 hypothetical protein [Photobacterium sp. Ph5]
MTKILLLVGLLVSSHAMANDQALYNTLAKIVYVEHGMGKAWVIVDDIHCDIKQQIMQCDYKEGTEQRTIKEELAQQLVNTLQPFVVLDNNDHKNLKQLAIKNAKCLKKSVQNSSGEPNGDYQYQCIIEK